MGLNSFLTSLAKQGRSLDKQLRRDAMRERKADRKEEAKEKIRAEKRAIRIRKADRREEAIEKVREEKIYIRTKNLPPPYIGEIRWGHDIPHKRSDNCSKYVYKHCSETKKYEWVKIEVVKPSHTDAGDSVVEIVYTAEEDAEAMKILQETNNAHGEVEAYLMGVVKKRQNYG